MASNVIFILAILYFLMLIAIWVSLAFLMVKVISLRKPNVHLWFDTFFNPFNLVFMSSKLTNEGLKVRNKMFVLAAIFSVLIPFSFLVAEILNKYKNV